MNKYIIVSEGPTDFEVLRAVIEAECGGNTNCSIEHLYPCSVTKEEGGWSNFRTWCKRQSMTSRQVLDGRRRAAALLGTLSNNPGPGLNGGDEARVDKIAAALSIRAGYAKVALIFQLDTDVAEEYHRDAGLPHVSYPLNSYDRREIGIAAIKQWIGHHAEKIGRDIILCVSTHSLETYLLAIHTKEQINQATSIGGLPDDYDNIPAPERILIALKFQSKTKYGKRVLSKNPQNYKTHATKLIANLASAKLRSSGLADFCRSIKLIQ